MTRTRGTWFIAFRLRPIRTRVSFVAFAAVFVPVYVLVRVLTFALRAIGWPRWWPDLQPRLGIRRRVLYLEPFYPEISGYAYRVQIWIGVLESAGFGVRVRHPLSHATSRRLLDDGWVGVFYAVYLLRRLPQVLSAAAHSRVVVRRELLLYDDYGDLFLDRLLLTINPHVILDFDDDISAAKQEPRPISRVGRVLGESPAKFRDCLRLYPRFIAGSAYLRQLALDARDGEPADIAVVPTCVSYEHEPAKRYTGADGQITLGWIGTDGNLPQIERIVPALEEVAREQPLRLVVISGRGLHVPATFEIDNRRWSLESQIGDLLDIDVGLMPLVDSRVERGKCGFKQIQYMGLGILGVASAITTNREIVSDGVDGFLVEPGDSWADALRRVLAQRDDFAQIGAAARETVQRRYSVAAHADAYVAFIARDLPDYTPGR